MSPQEETELFRVNNQLCSFSADGRFLAIAYQMNLIIKNTGTFDVFYLFTFADVIEYLEWSPDSEYILCANIKRSLIQVYCIPHPQWKFRLTEGSAGLECVTWSPDSKHILTLSDFNIQLSIWSLQTLSVSHIQHIKSSTFDRLHFSSDNLRLALIITHNEQDTVEIYKTDHWRISRKLICERLSSIDGICWSPNNELLCIWCASTGEPKLIIYSVPADKNIAVFCPMKCSVPRELKYSLSGELMGIERIQWMPNGQLLTVVGLNETIVLLNHITWKPILRLCLDPVIRDSNYLNKVYRQCTVQSKGAKKCSKQSVKYILQVVHDRPLNIQIDRKECTNRLSIAKTALFQFSHCGQYLAIVHQLYPSTVWIWNIGTDYVDYILLVNNATAVKWNPRRAQLIVFCECAHIFEWNPNSAKCIPAPRGITILDGRWHPQGKILTLCGYNKAVIYRIEDEYE